MEEFFDLCDVMLYQKGVTPFTWPGNNAYYPTKMMENYWASYEGADNYRLNYTFDSKGEPYTFLDGTTEPVTIQNGYKLKNGQPGKKASLQFMYDIMRGHNGSATNGEYHSGGVFSSGYDNRAAQDEYLLSNNLGSQPVAFLIDSSWWEREAIKTFNDIVKRTKEEKYAYGTREFALMPIPSMHDGEGQTDVYSAVGENSQVFINKNTKVAEEAVDFFRFLHTDRILALMTSYSNTLRPYKYSVEGENLERMTPFGRSIVSMLDSIVRVPPLCQDKAIRLADPGFFSWQAWQYGTEGLDYYPSTLFYNNKNLTVDELLSKMAVDKDEWDEAFGSLY